MMRVFRLLAMLIVASFFVAPAVVSEAKVPVRLVENVTPGASLQQLSDSDPDLAAALDSATVEVRKAGRVRVAVKTAVAFAPETLLGDWERTVQRREIARAAADLRKSMPKARDFEALPDMPYVLLTVDGPGLIRLQSIPGLVRIAREEAFNWRRDFVQLRVATRARAARFTGPEPMRRVTPRIVGGTDASPGIHPFQVGLMVRRISDNYRALFCGGTLVSPYHVVTAAHCVDDISNPGRDLQVLVGTQTLARRGGGKRINISRIFIHPGWNSITNDYDAAVLELATPVTGIAFATLANTEPTTPGNRLRTTGWGTLDNWGTRPTVLQQLDVPFVPTLGGSCGGWGDISSGMLCAGGLRGQDSCVGDSGGPLTIDRGAGYTEMVGIVSFGTATCAIENFPGVYANVAESSINSFIRGIVDAPRAFAFQISNLEVNEGGRRVTLTVTRSLAAGSASVVVATAAGSAAAKADFKAVSRKLTFKPGVASVSVPITIVNDRIVEGPENFTATLSSPSAGFSLGDRSTVAVTIADND